MCIVESFQSGVIVVIINIKLLNDLNIISSPTIIKIDKSTKGNNLSD